MNQRLEIGIFALSGALKGIMYSGTCLLWILLSQVPVIQVARFPWEGLFALVGTLVAAYYTHRTTVYLNDRKKDDVINGLQRDIDVLKMKIEYMQKEGEHDHPHDKVKHDES